MFEYDTCNCLIRDIKMKISVILDTLPFWFKAKTKIMRRDINRNYMYLYFLAVKHGTMY